MRRRRKGEKRDEIEISPCRLATPVEVDYSKVLYGKVLYVILYVKELVCNTTRAARKSLNFLGESIT